MSEQRSIRFSNMYHNIFIRRNKNNTEVHLWDDKAGYQKFQYKPYAYMKSPSGTYRSMYGDKLKKVNYWTQEDVQDGLMFESDVPVETRVLIDKYSDSDEVSKGHRELYFDIEVEVKGGFPDVNRAENKITAIALYDKTMDKYSCFVLGNVPNTDVVESFQSEEELLQRFYQKYLEINPTILSGWNIDGFDIPYLYNRTTRVLGEQFANSLSPIGTVLWSENKKRYKIAGVSCMDYFFLYRKFTYTQQSSYRLDFIGQLEVGIGKIEYEGTLDDLYKSDINKYIEYNLNDVKIVKALDDKLQLIDLARGISHLGHIPYEDVYFSSRFLEGAALVYLKNMEIVAPNKNINGKQLMNRTEDDKATGAYVMEPKQGRHDWVYDLDLTSMYPSIMMTLNISPEMKIGRLEGWNAEEYMKGTRKTYSLVIKNKVKDTFNETELKSMLASNNVSIASNGVIYKNEKKGLIPSLLVKWFNERVEYKKLAKKYGNEGNEEKYGYFNRRQHVQKIVLNSLYGSLGLPVFRFYDKDNVEATTITGQTLIKFTQKIANSYYNSKLGDKEDYCIYTDTDSVFYPAIPLIQNKYPDVDLNDEKFMTDKILDTAGEVQDYINKSYDLFAVRFLNVKGEHRFDIKQEVISRAAFWVTKKRYGQWIINDGGVVCDKLDVKGLDIVRSNFPPLFRDFMTDILKSILKNIDKEQIDDKIIEFKNNIKTADIYDIALPTGVKNLKKFKNTSIKDSGIFTALRKGTPVHVKAAWKYNDLLKHFDLSNHESIKSSDKIKWVYLKESNPYRIPQLAFKGYDDPEVIIEDVIKKYIDFEKLFDKALYKKIKTWYEALDWSQPVDKKYTLDRFF